jgi:hypothetical protein
VSLLAKNVFTTAFNTDTNNVFHCVVIVPTSVLYVQGYVQETLLMLLNFVPYVPKFVRPVQKNVVNTPNTTKVAKLVQRLVKLVPKLVHNLNDCFKV